MNKTQLPEQKESDHQIALFQWVSYQLKRYPELELLYHIPNGGYRYKTTARRLKAEGVKAGVPDICLPVPRGGYHGLYIEMKAGKKQAYSVSRAMANRSCGKWLLCYRMPRMGSGAASNNKIP